jgi:1,4-dihydroxy-2-naphthoyl-CoA hydrolase
MEIPPDPAAWNAIGAEMLPGLLGVEFLEVAAGRARARMEVSRRHNAPNGYLHAASVIALADTACGYGCVASLPEGGVGFTTIDLSANFTGTVREGAITCEATLNHGGRTVQVWDAVVRDEGNGRQVAVFRCTQMVRYPR